jgi:SAM-dependent methyltransferase
VLHAADGRSWAVDHRRWHGELGGAERELLRSVRGAALDIGCGPGRIAAALVRSGRHALGIDTAPAAVAATRRRGAPAFRASVFDRIPGEGSWGSALLVDGNIGIGGDPVALLQRTGCLVSADGLILVEVGAPGSGSTDLEVRVEHDGRVGPWFPWSRLAVEDLAGAAGAAGLLVERTWAHSGRWFAHLAARRPVPG